MNPGSVPWTFLPDLRVGGASKRGDLYEIVNLGIGKSIKFTDVTTENLSEALNEVY